MSGKHRLTWSRSSQWQYELIVITVKVLCIVRLPQLMFLWVTLATGRGRGPYEKHDSITPLPNHMTRYKIISTPAELARPLGPGEEIEDQQVHIIAMGNFFFCQPGKLAHSTASLTTRVRVASRTGARTGGTQVAANDSKKSPRGEATWVEEHHKSMKTPTAVHLFLDNHLPARSYRLLPHGQPMPTLL